MPERSRILVDVSAGGEVLLDLEVMRGSGHEVVVCHGPGPNTLCPLLAGRGCEMLEEADGVVYQFDLDRPQHRDILAAYKEALPEDIPIRVAVVAGQEARYEELLHGVQVWTHSPSAGDLDGFAAEVEAANWARS